MTTTRKQPSAKDEQELLDINEDRTTLAKILNKSYKIKYLKPYTTEKVTRILVEARVAISDEMTEMEALKAMEERSRSIHKCAAYIILNRTFKIWLLHGILWRYFYFIKEYDYKDLMEVVETGKKKIRLLEFLAVTVSLETMKETKMMMTRREAKPFLQELFQEYGQASEKRTDGL